MVNFTYSILRPVIQSGFFLFLFAVPVNADLLLHWRFEPHFEHLEPDASESGRKALLLRNDYDQPEPERVAESMHGQEAGSVKLTRDSRIKLLNPVELPESWTLSFWIKDTRDIEEIPEKIVAGDYVRISSGLIGLPNPWYFRFDSNEVGKEQGWNVGQNDGEWERIKVPAFWHETHVGRKHGYGWYKTTFHVPEEYAEMEHELHFEAVDEQAWIYINGEYVGEQTTESTGKAIGQIWDEPFSVMVGPEHLRGGEENLLVVRSHASGGAAGMYKPAYFLPPESIKAELDLSQLSGERITPGQWEHIAITFEPGTAGLYINGEYIGSVDEPLAAGSELKSAVIEFYQGGRGRFSGLLDDVRLYAGDLSENRIAELYDILYHPEASWLAEFDETVQKVAAAGGLSRERTRYMLELGVPDSSAIIETYATADRLNEQLDSIWALGAMGDYEAVTKLFELLDAEVVDIAEAAEKAFLICINEGHYPAVFVKRGDDDAIDLIRTLTMRTDNVQLQNASVDGLREATSDYEAITVLKEKLDSEDGDLKTAAEEGLLRMNEENIFPDVLVDRADADSEFLLERITWLTADESLQWISARGLAELAGDYKSLTVLIEKLASEVDALAKAADDGLMRFFERDIFPEILIERGDEEAVVLIGKVQRFSSEIVMQTAAMGALSELGDEQALRELAAALEKGPWRMRRATAKVLAEMGVETDADLAVEADGWPMWQYDPARSADIPYRLAEDLYLQWSRQLPEPERAWPHQFDDRGKHDFDVSYAPVASRHRLFVPSNVTDSVSAYDLENGSELWRFYTDGPVRLAPAVWRDRVFFVSDDGFLYCVKTDSGELDWKFRAGPSDHRLLGNERIINFWAARGGPVVKDGTVYFAAGIWPMHGIFIYALDTVTGDVVWVNDTTGSDYVPLPHGGAYGYGGLSPQGYLAVGQDELIVSAGRGQSPVYLERQTGVVTDISFRGSKGRGDYAVHAVDGGGKGMKTNQMLEERLARVEDVIDGEVFYKLAAYDRLVVSTECGRIYSFGPEKRETVNHALSSSGLEFNSDAWESTTESLLAELGESEGYALVLGAGSGDLFRELIVQSDMHVLVVESDPEVIESLRDELSGAGLYGRRAAVTEAEPASFTVQPYLFSLVVAENAEAAGIEADVEQLGSILEWLRPYGGIARLGTENVPAMVEAAGAVAVDQVEVEPGVDYLLARRGGPLTGAGKWTHQYHDAANTLRSEDELVRLPLGVLWFGGPNNHDILPRHSGGPRPQVVAGRQVYLGVDNISARCVYSGRRTWKRELPGIGHPFTNMDLERRWAENEEVYMTNIPGATYIGSPFVTLEDAVYLRYEGRILVLDLVTGETKSEFSLPGRGVEEIYGEDAPDWGHMSVSGDYLVTTAEPHIFEDQELGWTDSYSGTSSRLLTVMDRFNGEVLWEREAEIGFRHTGVISSEDVLFVIDGLSENALNHLARRGEEPGEAHVVMALDLATGEEIWSRESEVYGTYMLYSAEHDILIEGGSRDMRRPFDDEPGRMAVMSGSDGEIRWTGGGVQLPGSIHGEMLVPGRPGSAISILTGEAWQREDSLTGRSSRWSYRRAYGCNTHNASANLLLYRSGYAGFFDMEHDSGTGTFSGFRSGCTANMIAADGVLNALDYTRTCTCSYALQTSLALVHMPDDTNIEFWTRYDASSPSSSGHGLNFGAPGRRVDVAGGGLVWHDESGNARRHASAIKDNGGGLDWVAASVKEFNENSSSIQIRDLADGEYNLRLHFCELDENVNAGERIFAVRINNETVMEEFDIIGSAGSALRGVVKEFAAATERGAISIEFSKAGNASLNPIINGIELKYIER